MWESHWSQSNVSNSLITHLKMGSLHLKMGSLHFITFWYNQTEMRRGVWEFWWSIDGVAFPHSPLIWLTSAGCHLGGSGTKSWVMHLFPRPGWGMPSSPSWISQWSGGKDWAKRTQRNRSWLGDQRLPHGAILTSCPNFNRQMYK